MSYPKIFLRIKGMLLDSLLFGLIVYSSVFVLMWLGIENPVLKALFLILPVLIFEPLCVSLSGGSVGHHYAGIKVVDAKTGRNLNIILSVVRFVIKGVLGLVSLVSMLVTRKHQAIHDYFSHSVVIFKSGNEVPEHHKLAERTEKDMREGPSIPRRLVAILAYSVMWVFAIGVVMGFAASIECLQIGICSAKEDTMLNSISSIAAVVIVILIILGLMGKLPGAHYKK